MNHDVMSITLWIARAWLSHDYNWHYITSSKNRSKPYIRPRTGGKNQSSWATQKTRTSPVLHHHEALGDGAVRRWDSLPPQLTLTSLPSM